MGIDLGEMAKEIGKRCLVLAAILTIALSSATEEHPADDPHWFNMSRLSADDVHMIGAEASEYARQGKVLENAERANRAVEEARKEKKSAQLTAKLTAKVPDPESTSTMLAALQHDLALEIGHLATCTSALRKCGGDVMLGDPKEGSIEHVRTTAQEDWDETHNYESPPSRPWKLRPSEKLQDVKQTALQEYAQGQQDYPTEHDPGQKFEHDRLTHDQTAQFAKEASAARQEASSDLKRDVKHKEEAVAQKRRELHKSQDALDAAQKTAAVLGRFPTEQVLKAGLKQSTEKVVQCEADVLKCQQAQATAPKN